MAGERSDDQEDHEQVDVGSWIKVYWDGDDKWYSAEVTEFDPVTEWCKVLYEDGEREEFRLSEVKYRNISGDKMKEQEEAEDEGVYSKKSLRYIRLTLVDMADRLPEAAVRKDCRQWWDTWQKNVTSAAYVHNFDGLVQLAGLLGEQINVHGIEGKVNVTTDWWKAESKNWQARLAGSRSYGDLANRVRELLLRAVDWTAARNLFPAADSTTSETSGTETVGHDFVEKKRKRAGLSWRKSSGTSTSSSALALTIVETDVGGDALKRGKRRKVTKKRSMKATHGRESREKEGNCGQSSEEGFNVHHVLGTTKRRKLEDRAGFKPLDFRVGEDSEIIRNRLPPIPVSGARVIPRKTSLENYKVQVPGKEPRISNEDACFSGSMTKTKMLLSKKKKEQDTGERYPQDTGKHRSGNWGKNFFLTEGHLIETKKRGRRKQIPLVVSVSDARLLVDESSVCRAESSSVMKDGSDYVASRSQDGHQLLLNGSPVMKVPAATKDDPKVTVSAFGDTVGGAPPKVSVMKQTEEVQHSNMFLDNPSEVKKKAGRPRKSVLAQGKFGLNVGTPNQAESGAGEILGKAAEAQENQQQEQVSSCVNTRVQPHPQVKEKQTSGSGKTAQRRKPGRPRRVAQTPLIGSELNGSEFEGKRQWRNKMVIVEDVQAVKCRKPDRPRRSLLPIRASRSSRRTGILRSSTKTADTSRISYTIGKVNSPNDVDVHQSDQGACSSTTGQSTPSPKKPGRPRKSATYIALMGRRQAKGATLPSESKSSMIDTLVSYKRRSNGTEEETEDVDENSHIQAGDGLLSSRKVGNASRTRRLSSHLSQEEKESVVGTLPTAANGMATASNPAVSEVMEGKYYRRSFRKSHGRPPKKVVQGECQKSSTCASLSASVAQLQPQGKQVPEISGGSEERLSIQGGQLADKSRVAILVDVNGNRTPQKENISAAVSDPGMPARHGQARPIREHDMGCLVAVSTIGGNLQHDGRPVGSDGGEVTITSERLEAGGPEQIQSNEIEYKQRKIVGNKCTYEMIKDTIERQSLQGCEVVPSPARDNLHRSGCLTVSDEREVLIKSQNQETAETKQKLDNETGCSQGKVVEVKFTDDSGKDMMLQHDGQVAGSKASRVINEKREVGEMEQKADKGAGFGASCIPIPSINKSLLGENMDKSLNKDGHIEADTDPFLPTASVPMHQTQGEVVASEVEEQPLQIRTDGLQDGDASASSSSGRPKCPSAERVSSLPFDGTGQQWKSASTAEEACINFPAEKLENLQSEEMQVECKVSEYKERPASNDVPCNDAEHIVESEYPSWGDKLCSDTEDETGTSPVCEDSINHEDVTVVSFEQETFKPEFSHKLLGTKSVTTNLEGMSEDVSKITVPVGPIRSKTPKGVSECGEGNIGEAVETNTTILSDQNKNGFLSGTVCNICELKGVEDQMLQCKNGSCTCSIHTFCLNPPLQVVPTDAWTCLHCASTTESTIVTTCCPLTFPPKKIQGVIGRRSNLVNDEVKCSGLLRMEYLVKWDNISHWHDTWVDATWFVGEKERHVTLFESRHPELKVDVTKEVDNTMIDERKPKWLLIDRVIKCREHGVGQLHPSELSRTGYKRSGVQFLVKWQGLNYKNATWEETKFSKDMREAIHAFISRHEAAEVDPSHPQPREPVAARITRQPEYIHGGTLYGYQLEGLKWLVRSFEAKRNVVLADERLLGKTVQATAFIACVRHQKLSKRPVLVVAPNGALSEWEKELKFWTPALNTVVYQGEKENRDVIQSCEFYTEKGRPLFEVLLTSHKLAIKDSLSLSKFHWAAIIMDEGVPNKTRNMVSEIGGALKKYQAEFRLLLTCIPVLNSVDQLPSLSHFLDPVELPNSEDATAGNGGALDGVCANSAVSEVRTKQLAKIHDRLKSRILRRVKIEVPRVRIAGKKIVHVPCSFTPFQRKLYTAVLDRNFKLLTQGLSSGVKRSLTAVIAELKMVCNHPFISPENKPQVPESEETPRMMVDVSGKLLFLEKLLPLLKEENHRVLLVAQMTRMMDIIEEFLKFLRLSYIRVDGSTTAAERERAIVDFNRPECTDFIFLISAGAGGLGINLRSADTVIIYDPCFSPFADIQAQLRSLRIGQDQTVLVYRLFTEGSVEEKHVETQRPLENSNSGLKDPSQTKEDSASYSSEVLLHGLDQLLDENHVGAGYTEHTVESLRELLDRSGAESSPVVRVDYEYMRHIEKPVQGYGEKWRKLLARLVVPDESEESVIIGGGEKSCVKYSVEQSATVQVDSDCQVGQKDDDAEVGRDAEGSWSNWKWADCRLDSRQDGDGVNLWKIPRHSGLYGEVAGRYFSSVKCSAGPGQSQATGTVTQNHEVSAAADVGRGGSHCPPEVTPRHLVTGRTATSTGLGYDRVPASEGIGIHLNSLLPTATRNISSQNPVSPMKPDVSNAVFAEPTVFGKPCHLSGPAGPAPALNGNPVISVSSNRTNGAGPEISTSVSTGPGMSRVDKSLEVAGSVSSREENMREPRKYVESSSSRPVQNLILSGSNVVSVPAPLGGPGVTPSRSQPAILCRRRPPVNPIAVTSTLYAHSGQFQGATNNNQGALPGRQNSPSANSATASTGATVTQGRKSDIRNTAPRHQAFTQMMQGQIAACSMAGYNVFGPDSLKKPARNLYKFGTAPAGNHTVAVTNIRNLPNAPAAAPILSAVPVSPPGKSQTSQPYGGTVLANQSTVQLRPSEPVISVRSFPPVSSLQDTIVPLCSSVQRLQDEIPQPSSNPAAGAFSPTNEDTVAPNKGQRKPLWLPKGDADETQLSTPKEIEFELKPLGGRYIQL
ncbi:hypothetical protein R1flu_012718 [Riccia fluitans]|uniref:Uncharacterized protein n=1 Tax=Riccia fluitans TaxID=41844 RepID=A0ABD1ZBJ0_9MARC